MAIVVECPRCGRVTHFADNDAGLAVGCLSCGQVTRVPDLVPKVAAPAEARPAEPDVRWTRVKGSGGRPVVYAAGVLLVAVLIGGLGYVKYRSVVRDRATVVATGRVTTTQAAATRPTLASETSAPRQVPAPPAMPVTSVAVASAPVTEQKPEPVARVVGFVGLERLELNGRYSVDSYNSAAVGYRPGASRSNAPVLSNQKVRLYGAGQVQGFVRVGKGGDFKKSDDVTISSPVTDDGVDAGRPLDTPAVDAAGVKVANDNDQLPEKYFRGGSLVVAARKTVGLPAGIYDLKDLVIEPRATLVVDGSVTIVVSGQFIVNGGIETNDQRPANLKLRLAGGEGAVAINNQSELYFDLYAPGRMIEIFGSGDVYGSIVGRTLRMHGERGLHFDESILPVMESENPAR
jgi:hypothetical protein